MVNWSLLLVQCYQIGVRDEWNRIELDIMTTDKILFIIICTYNVWCIHIQYNWFGYDIVNRQRCQFDFHPINVPQYFGNQNPIIIISKHERHNKWGDTEKMCNCKTLWFGGRLWCSTESRTRVLGIFTNRTNTNLKLKRLNICFETFK